MTTLRDYYKLNKDSFSIDPRDDAAAYFGGSRLDERIRDRIETDFNQQRQVPKFCLYGPYGVGKTHNLQHIAHDLMTTLAEDYPSDPIILDISPIRGKEKWKDIHSNIINAIGLGRIKEGVQQLLSDPEASKDPVTYLVGQGVLKFGEAAIKNSQGQVFRALAFGGPMEAAALQWLKGESLTAAQAETIGIEMQLTEVSHLVAALLNVAGLIRVGLGKRPVLLIDEAEALNDLSHQDSLNEFRAALRKLADNENNVLGLIIAFYADDTDDAPAILTDPAVFRRFGYDAAFIDLLEAVGGMDNVKTFITDILSYLVDQDAVREIIEDEGLDTEPEFFPFTPDAIERLAEFIMEEDPANQVPSQIIERMSNAVVQGWREGRGQSEGHVLVDDNLVEAALYPQEQ